MIENIFQLSQSLMKVNNKPYVRYFQKKHPLNNRFSILLGQRGVGKTTIMVQHLLSLYEEGLYSKKILFVQADHFLIGSTSLYEIAEEFNNLGGEVISFDEIHKYSGWSGELKSIYDTFPKLKIIASGSSALEIHKGSHDLSRRAVIYKVPGMSFREFIEMTLGISLDEYSLDELVIRHQQLSYNVIQKVEDKGRKILALFKDYLNYGYYPYFNEYEDKTLFYMTLEQNIHTTIESDLMLIYPSLTGNSIRKIRKLLSVIATSVPFKPDLNRLKKLLDIGDERTLKTYLKYLEDAGIILSVSKKSGGLKVMEKPEKIYLNNPNLMSAISPDGIANIGTVRETFFLNVCGLYGEITIPPKGDFFVNNTLTFEVGGKTKGFTQIKDTKNSFLALDGIETGFERKIPLWLFGFLY